MGICITGCHLIDCALPSRRGQCITDHAQLLLVVLVSVMSIRFFCFNTVPFKRTKMRLFQKQHMELLTSRFLGYGDLWQRGISCQSWPVMLHMEHALSFNSCSTYKPDLLFNGSQWYGAVTHCLFYTLLISSSCLCWRYGTVVYTRRKSRFFPPSHMFSYPNTYVWSIRWV
jgi:hypothetical protein